MAKENESEKLCQRQLSAERGTFGPLGTAAGNGCGSIALYHVLRLLGRPVAYHAVLAQMNREWWKSTIAGGLLGSNPCYIWNQIRRLPGIRCRFFFCLGRAKRQDAYWRMAICRAEKSHTLFLNLYFHRSGAHYTVAERRNGVFHIYNDPYHSKCLKAYYHDTGAWAMVVLGIDKREENDL